jgi:hypothetical protein
MPPATQSQRTQRKRPGDLTGVRGQTLAAEAAANKEEAARQVQSAQELQRQEKINTDVDYSTKVAPLMRRPVEHDGEMVVEDVAVEIPTRRIRVNYPIEDMTFGREVIFPGELNEHGAYVRSPVLGGLRSYTFEEGRYYVVDADLADHLAFLGYIYE